MTLDHVRNLKNKQALMLKKVEAVVEELDRLMDDDDDMRRMILSDDFFEDEDLLESSAISMSGGTPRSFGSGRGPFGDAARPGMDETQGRGRRGA